jgi:hypothetical protein
VTVVGDMGEQSVSETVSEPVDQNVAAQVFATRVVTLTNVIVTIAGIAIVTFLFIVYIWKSAEAQYFTPFSLLEEAAYTFISANNYLHFGYLNSGLLQDFATNLNPADHPYIYNHMPPGPDLVTSGWLWLTGNDYRAVRFIFAVALLSGMIVYLLFARELMHQLGVRLYGLALLLITPWTIVQLFDRQVYSLFPLLTFLPLLFGLRFLRTNNMVYLAGTAAIITLSTFYLEYSMLSAVIVCWGMLYITQLVPLSLRHMLIIGTAFAVGIGAHLLQNMLVLGWHNFVQELHYTLSNRITGYPTQQQLEGFYHQLGVLHHGSHPIQPRALVAQVAANFSVPAASSGAAMLVACGLWVLCGRAVSFGGVEGRLSFDLRAAVAGLSLLGRMTVWAVITILAPIFLFPAFAQEVNLRGVGNFFFLALLLTFLAGYGLWLLCYCTHRAIAIVKDPMAVSGRPNADVAEAGPAVLKLVASVGRILAVTGIALALAGTAYRVVTNTSAETSHILGLNPQKWSPLNAISRYKGSLFMTNINVPTVGFLTRAPGFGVCGPKSVKKDGSLDLLACKTAFVRRYDYWLSQRPRYFFYFTSPELFPGFADCMPQGLLLGSARDDSGCMQDLADRLESRYARVMSNGIVTVFDINKPKP